MPRPGCILNAGCFTPHAWLGCSSASPHKKQAKKRIVTWSRHGGRRAKNLKEELLFYHLTSPNLATTREVRQRQKWHFLKSRDQIDHAKLVHLIASSLPATAYLLYVLATFGYHPAQSWLKRSQQWHQQQFLAHSCEQQDNKRKGLLKSKTLNKALVFRILPIQDDATGVRPDFGSLFKPIFSWNKQNGGWRLGKGVEGQR